MIRAFETTDLADVLEVWSRAARIAHPFLDDAFLARERDQIATVHLPNAETMVYIVDGRAAGFLSLVGNEIGGLFVDPDRQGRGIGRALVNHARTLRPSLEVEVFEANHLGRRFYERYGFVPVREEVHAETGHRVIRMHLAHE